MKFFVIAEAVFLFATPGHAEFSKEKEAENAFKNGIVGRMVSESAMNLLQQVFQGGVATTPEKVPESASSGVRIPTAAANPVVATGVTEGTPENGRLEAEQGLGTEYYNVNLSGGSNSLKLRLGQDGPSFAVKLTGDFTHTMKGSALSPVVFKMMKDGDHESNSEVSASPLRTAGGKTASTENTGESVSHSSSKEFRSLENSPCFFSDESFSRTASGQAACWRKAQPAEASDKYGRVWYVLCSNLSATWRCPMQRNMCIYGDPNAVGKCGTSDQKAEIDVPADYDQEESFPTVFV